MISEVKNMDCVEYMKEFEDKFFDLAIVDPPYGININHNMGRRKGDKHSDYKKADWDSAPPDSTYFNELFRVSKNQIIWGANHFISYIAIDSNCWLIWDKKFSDELSFSQCELAWSSFNDTGSKLYTYTPQSQSNRIHPTQKPIDLYEWILSVFARENDKILDTHIGSGSSRIACSEKYDFYGTELDKDHYLNMERRYQKYLSNKTNKQARNNLFN